MDVKKEENSMKKQLIAGLFALFLLVGCSSDSKSAHTAACSFDAAEGMKIDFTVTAPEDTITKVNYHISLDYKKLGYDLSKVSDNIKKSTASNVLEQLGFSSDNKGVTVKTKYDKTALNIDVEINLEKADSEVLDVLGFTNSTKEDLNFKKFLKNAQNSGVTCK